MECINARFDKVVLTKRSSLTHSQQQGKQDKYFVYSTLIKTMTLDVVVMFVLSKNDVGQKAHFEKLEWDSIHVRSYNSASETYGNKFITFAKREYQKLNNVNRGLNRKIFKFQEERFSADYKIEGEQRLILHVFGDDEKRSALGTVFPEKSDLISNLNSNNFVIKKV